MRSWPVNDPQLDQLVLAIADAEKIIWEYELGEEPSAHSNNDILLSLSAIHRIAEAHRSLTRMSPSPELPFLRWGHLELRALIGAGRYGEVYRAWDDTLGREVALKLFRNELFGEPVRRNWFLEEARRMAKLRHENIAMVFGAEIHEGRLGYWMELVDGRTLKSVLADHGPLSARDTLSIGIQIARALVVIHRASLLHRDLSSSNVILDENEKVFLVDFGASAGANVAGDAASPQNVGTPLFMAPESLLHGASSSRSDIYSLGVLLFHLMTGSFPVEGTDLDDLAAHHRESRAHNLLQRRRNRLRSTLAGRLMNVVYRCIETEPVGRYQAATELLADLAKVQATPSFRFLNPYFWALAVVAISVFILINITHFRAQQIRRASTTEVVQQSALQADHTILVLPMRVHGEVGGEYLGMAFAEAIAVNLARAIRLNVLPVPMDEPSAPFSDAALKLGADCLISGSLIRNQGTYQINVQLVDSRTNRILWGVQKDVEQQQLSSYAVVVAKDVSHRLHVSVAKQYEYFRYVTGSETMANSTVLTEAIGAARRHDVFAALSATKDLIEEFPNEPEAHVLRLVALTDASNYDSSPANLDAFRAGIASLEHVDPHHPLVDLLRSEAVSDDQAVLTQSISRLTKILSRDDLTPGFRAHVLRTRGRAESLRNRMGTAMADFEEALRLDPAISWTYLYLADVLMAAGRIDDSIIRARQAVALEQSAATYSTLAEELFQANRLEEALSSIQRAKELGVVPTSLSIQYRFMSVLSQLGKHEEALAAADELCRHYATNDNCFAVAIELVKLKRLDEARAAAERAVQAEPGSPPSYNQACYYALCDSVDEALDVLKSLLKDGELTAGMAKDPNLAALSRHPRFKEIVAEVRDK